MIIIKGYFKTSSATINSCISLTKDRRSTKPTFQSRSVYDHVCPCLLINKDCRSKLKNFLQPMFNNDMTFGKRFPVAPHNDRRMAMTTVMDKDWVFLKPHSIQRIHHVKLCFRKRQNGELVLLRFSPLTCDKCGLLLVALVRRGRVAATGLRPAFRAVGQIFRCLIRIQALKDSLYRSPGFQHEGNAVVGKHACFPFFMQFEPFAAPKGLNSRVD